MGEGTYLFLQGPHGPFFRLLAGALSARGAGVRRVAFNDGDVAEWGGAGPLDAYTGALEEFEPWLRGLVAVTGLSDIVLYGDSRPQHGAAIRLARRLGLRTHCFEEGYLRPHWITYERQGTNGNSPLCRIPLEEMARAVGPGAAVAPLPAHWGDARQHLWWSARYHARQLRPTPRFRGYRGHRQLPLAEEVVHYVRRTATALPRSVTRSARHRRVLDLGAPFHLVLLQLSFDCSMQAHSRYDTNRAYVAELMDAFAAAPVDHHLVFKAHPFEDGRERLGPAIAGAAAARGLGGRVHFIDGGAGLGPLLDRAAGVLTVNSTAGQQALARGLPLHAAGASVYARPGLAATGDPAAFFARPPRPDAEAYRVFRSYMLATSQVAGSFYGPAGIARALAALPGLMLDPVDPYGRFASAVSEPGSRFVA